MSRPSDEALAEYLFGLRPRGQKYGLDRMRLLAAELGHPERATPVVHVAGTNGKGSVAAMLEAILRAAGWRVGLFTSPHLVQVGERVQVGRVPLSASELAAYVTELDPVADRIAARVGAEDRPSFFEFMTAMALLEFARKRCDIAVLEVGLGGEFDATNIVTPEVSVITSIGLDHCEWLGHTIEQIAKAKAGIVKPGRPVVVGRLPAEAERVVREMATARQAPVISVRERFGDSVERCPETSLAGEYQRWNAATAMLAAQTLGDAWRIDEATARRGLREVSWPGRWERRTIGGRIVILDASHNPEGAEALERNLAELVRGTGRKPVVVVGVLGTDRARPLLAAIARHAAEIHLVVPNQPRATGFAALEGLIPAEFQGARVRTTVNECFPGGDVCAAGNAADVVVVTGSIYLLGEVMTQLASKSR
jgi:dihydrofolate synthase/folylpolyglutamate synthase